MLNICIFLLQNKSVTPEELGPIACLAGYAIQLLYQQSKKSKDADFSRNDETHVYIFSMKVPTDENTFLVGQFNAEVLSGCLTKNHAVRFTLKIRFAFYLYHELPLF